jgi:DNA-directed RNA polymerase subunit RPC12/RpoP
MKLHRERRELIPDNETQLVYFSCPSCEQTITFDNEVSEDMILTCPVCGTKGIIKSPQKTHSEPNSSPDRSSLGEERRKVSVRAIGIKMLGIFLILIGFVLHFIFDLFSVKVSYALMIIGAVIFAFFSDSGMILINIYRKNTIEKESISNKERSSLKEYLNGMTKQFEVSEKIASALILWIIFVYLVTGVDNIDIFLILIYLGILIIKVFSTGTVPVAIKHRINVFSIIFLFIFILVVFRRVSLV